MGQGWGGGGGGGGVWVGVVFLAKGGVHAREWGQGHLQFCDARWEKSNYGRFVSIYAPGVNVISAINTDNTAVATMSSTTTAAAHVSGVAALYLSSNVAADPAQVRALVFV